MNDNVFSLCAQLTFKVSKYSEQGKTTDNASVKMQRSHQCRVQGLLEVQQSLITSRRKTHTGESLTIMSYAKQCCFDLH